MTKPLTAYRLGVLIGDVDGYLRKHAETIDTVVATERTASAYPTVGDGPGGRGGSPSSPTERAVLDPTRTRLAELDAAAYRLAKALLEYRLAADAWLPRPEAEPVRAGAGYCAACDRWAPGGVDRLRSGLCNACRSYVARRRTKGVDRHAAIAERRRTLEAEAQARRLDGPADVVDLGHDPEEATP